MTYEEMDPKQAVNAWLDSLVDLNEQWVFLDRYGSWRDTEQSEQVTEIGTNLVSTVESEPRKCYQKSFQAVIESKTAEYVEGVAFTVGSIEPIKHAWVEVDETVIELTWKRRTNPPTPPAESVYYGYTIPSDKLIQLAFNFDRSAPFLPHYVERFY